MTPNKLIRGIIFAVFILTAFYIAFSQQDRPAIASYELSEVNSKSIVKFFKLHNIDISYDDISEAIQKPIDGDYEYGVLIRLASKKNLNDIIMRVEQQSLQNLPVNSIVNLDGVFYILRDASKDSITFWNPETDSIAKMDANEANKIYHKYGEAFMYLPRGYVKTF